RHRAIELFLNEAKIAGRLTHPNIVQVLDVGEVQGALYLAMEYVHGKDLQEVVKKLRQNHAVLPLGEAIHIVREVAQALHHAYWSTDINGQRLAVVHRDISPQNIILSYDGAIKLLDFGVAMSAVTEHAETMIVGKWLYMSPETTTTKQVDHRSDLFSLGVILYLLCSGYLPFTGREPKDIVRKIRAGQYKPLQELASVPDRLAVLVNRLVAPNPDDRPQRGQDVAVELGDIARQYGLTGSAPGIAYALSQLFPSDVAGGFDHIQVSTTTGMYDSKPTSLPPSTPSVQTTSPVSGPISIAAGAAHPVPTPQSSLQPLPRHVPTPQSSMQPLPRHVPTPQSSMQPLPRPQIGPQMPPPSLGPPVHTSIRTSYSFVKMLVALAVALLLAVGTYMLVRPS
ncbi:MAG TPA: protein kinase, partial [Kofleriaceae bacterium]|nr:protein kinase [Kofleriaceae bacterium]